MFKLFLFKYRCIYICQDHELEELCVLHQKSRRLIFYLCFRSGIKPIVGEAVACNVIDLKSRRMLIAGKRFYDSMTFLSVQQLLAATSCPSAPPSQRLCAPPLPPFPPPPPPPGRSEGAWLGVPAEGEAVAPLSLPISSVWLWWASLSG